MENYHSRKTRRERYLEKSLIAKWLPAAIVTVNFQSDENIGFLIRSAACFGIKDIFIIGKIPDKKLLNIMSGTLLDFVCIKNFSTPTEFSLFALENNYNIVAVELTQDASSIYDYQFSFEQKTAIVIGNETTGVPGNLLLNNDKVFIPMLGAGFCLNASQAGTTVMFEYSKQFSQKFI